LASVDISSSLDVDMCSFYVDEGQSSNDKHQDQKLDNHEDLSRPAGQEAVTRFLLTSNIQPFCSLWVRLTAAE
jgi:hypothetical protein